MQKWVTKQPFYNVENSSVTCLVIETESFVVTSLNYVLIVIDSQDQENTPSSGSCFLRQKGIKSRSATSKAMNPLHHCWQVVCCEPITSSSTGIGWHHGSTWQRSGLTERHGSSSFWKRLTECLTRLPLRTSMKGTRTRTHTHRIIPF